MKQWNPGWYFKRSFAQQVEPHKPQSAQKESADAGCRHRRVHFQNSKPTTNKLGPSEQKLLKPLDNLQSNLHEAAEQIQSRGFDSRPEEDTS